MDRVPEPPTEVNPSVRLDATVNVYPELITRLPDTLGMFVASV
jgi:hypothetical protein